jgi:hypothetical protein
MTVIIQIFMYISCQKDETEFTDTNVSDSESSETKTLLGKKLENPYTVENMQKAYENLMQNSQLKSKVSLNISTTDYYVRFFPKDDEELQLLEKDSLFLFNYPLDYEIEEIGDYYIDPKENKEDGQWYYTSVPMDYKFPDVEYEILADLYLPESVDDDDERDLKSTGSNQFLDELEDEALKITGNYTENEGSMLKRHKKKHPTGYVRVYDTERKALVGVEGVRVRTRRWFKYSYAHTTSTGYYRIHKRYRRDVHYCLFFVNSSGFKIRASTLSLWKAKHHVGKHNRNGYDFNIYQNSRAWRFCTVNNAVVKYRKYCDQFKIGKPNNHLRIVASNRNGGGAAPMLKHVWGFYGFTSKSKVVAFLGKVAGLPATILGNTFFKFVLPDIIIKANSSQGTAAVYETCFHELAHASHFKKVGCSFWIKYINYIVTYGAYGKGTGNSAGLCALSEAWGYHMGYYLLIQEYGSSNSLFPLKSFENYDPKNRPTSTAVARYKNNSGWTGWIPAGIMNDIIDTNKDWVRTGYKDNVSEYSLKNLFDALDKDVDSPQKFRNRLLSENGNKEKDDLKKLFEAYYWN